MRVVIAEDSVLLREGITRLLAENDATVVAALSDASRLLATVRETSPDLVIVDVRMPPTFTDEGRRVAIGGTALDPEVVAQLLVRSRRREPLASLTPREREVLGLMAEGLSNAGIAQQLSVGEGAVEKHITSIMSKLELSTSETEHRRV